jgi:hypothetical protein
LDERMIGYRAWVANFNLNLNHSEAYRLRGLFYPYFWRPGTNVAGCDRVRNPFFPPGSGHPPDSPNSSPASDCECGFWVLRTPDEASQYCIEHDLTFEAHVIGRVEVWGRLIEHVSGTRCQFAQVTGLQDSLSSRRSEQVRRLAEVYDVPVFS